MADKGLALAQDLIGLLQLAVLAFQRLHLLGHPGRDTCSLATIHLGWGGCRPSLTASRCANVVVVNGHERERETPMEEATIIGVDLAKNVFHLHGARADGSIAFRKKLSRPQFHKFMAGLARCLVVMQACGGAHHWAREMMRLGHDAKLIAPRYVKPFVKRHKNDANDAEAIVEAATRPTMRFVEVKTEAQQERAIVFRACLSRPRAVGESADRAGEYAARASLRVRLYCSVRNPSHGPDRRDRRGRRY